MFGQGFLVVRRNASRLTALACAGLWLSACAGTQQLGGGPNVQLVDAAELPAPQDAAGQPLGGYRIGAYDRLVVDVFGFPELTARKVQVDAAGDIAVPMAGSVNILGRTPAEAADLIAQRLRQAYVRNPQVAVNLEESLSQYVTVDGQVTQPGNYPVVSGMTLMRAVAAARGTSEFADLEDVVIFRTVGQQRMVALYNLGAIRRGVYPDPAIYTLDTIVVGDSPQRRMLRDLLQAAPALLSAPLVAILN